MVDTKWKTHAHTKTDTEKSKEIGKRNKDLRRGPRPGMHSVAHTARCLAAIAAILHIARYFFRETGTSQKCCDTPPWCLVLHRHICEIPRFATSRAIVVQYPIKTTLFGESQKALETTTAMKRRKISCSMTHGLLDPSAFPAKHLCSIALM